MGIPDCPFRHESEALKTSGNDSGEGQEGDAQDCDQATPVVQGGGCSLGTRQSVVAGGMGTQPGPLSSRPVPFTTVSVLKEMLLDAKEPNSVLGA